MTNKEWGNIGNNYLKGLFALAFQGFFMMVCVGIYAVLVNAMTISSDLHAAMFSVAAYTVILAFHYSRPEALANHIQCPLAGRKGAHTWRMYQYPKDLTKVKTKVALNLTKRQLIFTLPQYRIPFYLFMRKPIGSSIAAILMVTIMLHFLQRYEKTGL